RGDSASSSLSRGCARTGWCLQDAARNFSGKLRGYGFDVSESCSKFRGHTRFRCGHFGRSPRARFLNLRSAFVEQFLARGFLLRVNLPASLPQGLLILLYLLSCTSLGSFRSLLRAHGARVALGQDRKSTRLNSSHRTISY